MNWIEAQLSDRDMAVCPRCGKAVYFGKTISKDREAGANVHQYRLSLYCAQVFGVISMWSVCCVCLWKVYLGFELVCQE